MADAKQLERRQRGDTVHPAEEKMRGLLVPFQRCYIALTIAVAVTLACLGLAQTWPAFWILFAPAAALSLLGLHDLLQTRHSSLVDR